MGRLTYSWNGIYDYLLSWTSTTPPPIVYATDRSKAVVPVLFLFCVALCLYNGLINVLKSSSAICPCVSSFLLAL